MSGQSHDEAPGRDGGTRTPREGVDDEVLEFAQMLFQLAREGGTERLAAYVDAGESADLTNERGDAFLMLAAYNGHPDTVRALLDRAAVVGPVRIRATVEEGQRPRPDPARRRGLQGLRGGGPRPVRGGRRPGGGRLVRGGRGPDVREARLPRALRHVISTAGGEAGRGR